MIRTAGVPRTRVRLTQLPGGLALGEARHPGSCMGHLVGNLVGTLLRTGGGVIPAQDADLVA